jgi:hypothetical protein
MVRRTLHDLIVSLASATLAAACGHRVVPSDSADSGSQDAQVDAQPDTSLDDAALARDGASDVVDEVPGYGIGYIRASQGTEGAANFVLAHAAFVPPSQPDPHRREFEFAGCRWFEASQVGPTDRIDDLRIVDRVGALPFVHLGSARPVYEASDNRLRWQGGDPVELVAESIGLRFSTVAPTAAVVTLPPNGSTISRGGSLHYRISMPERADARVVVSFFANVLNPAGVSIRRRADCTVSAIVSEGDIPWAVFERLDATNVGVEAGAGDSYIVNIERYSLHIRFIRNPIGRNYVIQQI